jgi:hypothetical protein
MPLCPQITNTPIPVVLNADFTVTNVIPVLPATTTQVNQALVDAAAALAQADAALIEAGEAYTAAIGSLQPSANTIVNASNQMTAINGGGITVYSGASATTGARVVLNSAGLAGFNSSGTATFSVSASDGAAVFSGSVTGAAITGSSLNIGGNFIVNGSTGAMTATGATITGTITATSGSFTGTINSTTGTIGGFNIGATYLSTGDGTTGFFINSSSGAGSFNNLTANGNLLANSGLVLATGACTVSAGGNTFNNVGPMNVPTGDVTLVSGRLTTNTLTVNSTATMNGDVNLATGKDLRVPFAFDTTTANAATVWISSTGQFRRSTASSERYKTDIVNLNDVPELDPKALYDLPVRAFRFKDGYLPETDDRFGVLVPGFIAEEMDAIYPAATDYADGVETWNDRMIIPAMLALIQDQQARIKALEGA